MAEAAGWWGPPTANYGAVWGGGGGRAGADWCEPNYVWSRYVAEWWNTLSSGAVVLVGGFVLRAAIRLQYGRMFAMAGAGLALVGIGSVAFHGTLLRAGQVGWAVARPRARQVLDEVPMLISALLFLWIGLALRLTASAPRGEAAGRIGLAGAGLGCYGVVSTAVYFMDGGFGYFISSYVVTVGLVAAVSLWHLKRSPVSGVTRSLAFGSLGCYVGGALLLWLPEQMLCGNRLHDSHQSVLLRLPVPLHAFFHLTSAVGPLLWLTFAAFEWLHLKRRKPALVMSPAAEMCGLPLPLAVPYDTAEACSSQQNWCWD